MVTVSTGASLCSHPERLIRRAPRALWRGISSSAPPRRFEAHIVRKDSCYWPRVATRMVTVW